MLLYLDSLKILDPHKTTVKNTKTSRSTQNTYTQYIQTTRKGGWLGVSSAVRTKVGLRAFGAKSREVLAKDQTFYCNACFLAPFPNQLLVHAAYIRLCYDMSLQQCHFFMECFTFSGRLYCSFPERTEKNIRRPFAGHSTSDENCRMAGTKYWVSTRMYFEQNIRFFR